MDNLTMRGYAQRFAEYKHAAGVAFVSGEYWLNRYMDYHESKYPTIPFPTKESVNGFVDSLNLKDKSGITYIREFGTYLRVMGVNAFVYSTPIPRNIPDPPYIITLQEGETFFKVAHSHFNTTRCWVGKDIILPALFTTMWCCGTRTAECRKLLRKNVDLGNRYIDIMNAKGNKDRCIIISEDLQSYLSNYDDQMEHLRPNRQFFFPGAKDSSPISASRLGESFRECWYAAFPDFDRATRVRLYDFRHHFVYANLNRWLEEGVDINVMIYYLMKVTGHKSLQELLYYFHLVPEIYQAIKDKAEDLEVIYPDTYYLDEEEEV
jgi:integrase